MREAPVIPISESHMAQVMSTFSAVVGPVLASVVGVWSMPWGGTNDGGAVDGTPTSNVVVVRGGLVGPGGGGAAVAGGEVAGGVVVAGGAVVVGAAVVGTVGGEVGGEVVGGCVVAGRVVVVGSTTWPPAGPTCSVATSASTQPPHSVVAAAHRRRLLNTVPSWPDSPTATTQPCP